jgi:hypothetical protein
VTEALATSVIPCDIEHVDEYHEAPGVAVGKDGDLAYVEIYGLDNTVSLYFGLNELGLLISHLEDIEMEIVREGEDGDTGDNGVGG